MLGPVRAADGDRELRLRGRKQRALLAILLLQANKVVSRARLIEGLWGEAAPRSAPHTLDDYISRLRKALGDGCLERRPPGYVLTIERDQLDLHRFEDLLRDGREALSRGDATSAADKLRRALALWRGPPLADVLDEPFAHAEARHLEERRLIALEARVEAELALGRASELVPELEALVREHPFRERLTGQLMLALYRSGRQTEALACARMARGRLAEELGLYPGPQLQRLEQAILEQHSSLEGPGSSMPAGDARRQRGGRQRHRSRALAIVALVAAMTVVAIASVSPGSPVLRATANSIGVINTHSETLSAAIKTGGRPGGIAAGLGAIWVTDTAADELLDIDPLRRTVERIPVGHGPTAVAVGDGEVWVVNQLDRTVSEVNPLALKQVGSFQVGGGADAAVFAGGSLWVANRVDDTLSRISPAAGRVRTIPLSGAPAGLAAGPQGLWVTNSSTGQLLLIDRRTGKTTEAVQIGNGPAGAAVGAGAVWVANTQEGTVSRFDPSSGTVSKINVGKAPKGVGYGAGAVWVTNSLDGMVARIDPGSSSLTHVSVGGAPTALAVTGQDVWTTVLPASASHRGGTLRVVEGSPFLSVGRSLDPARFAGLGQWQTFSLTNDGLVTYRRVDGLGGGTLVPDLATSLPTPMDGGRTYTFQLRSGVHYSTGGVVKPEDFRRAVERVFSLGDPYAESFYTGIAGAPRCERSPARCDLSAGIVADDSTNTVTFHLSAPDPDFPYKLAFPMADAVPATAPSHDIAPTRLPATGPYMTATVSRSRSQTPAGALAYRSWTLIRNPRFHEWSADAQPDGYPDRIVIAQSREPRRLVGEIERGSIDVLVSPPADAVKWIAVHDSNRLHSGPLAATFALVMNTRAAPFDRLAVRQALNYAVDRGQLLDLAGGPLAAQLTCQILPPTLSGFQPYCPYTSDPSPGGSWSAPNLAKAQQLVDASKTRGMRVTMWVPTPDPAMPTVKIGRRVVSLLDQLGYHATLKTAASVDARLADSRAHGQIGWFPWYQDYPAPSDFIDPLLTCRAFIPHNRRNLNLAEFCDPKIDAQVQHATSIEPLEPGVASEIWQHLDRTLTDEAAWIPLYNPRVPTVLSARVGNYQFHPFWQLLLDQLWVR